MEESPPTPLRFALWNVTQDLSMALGHPLQWKQANGIQAFCYGQPKPFLINASGMVESRKKKLSPSLASES